MCGGGVGGMGGFGARPYSVSVGVRKNKEEGSANSRMKIGNNRKSEIKEIHSNVPPCPD